MNSNFGNAVFETGTVIDTNAEFENIFTEGQAPVAIASENILIGDELDSISSATIVLTNPEADDLIAVTGTCLLYTSPSPRDATLSRMPSSA